MKERLSQASNNFDMKKLIKYLKDTHQMQAKERKNAINSHQVLSAASKRKKHLPKTNALIYPQTSSAFGKKNSVRIMTTN